MRLAPRIAIGLALAALVALPLSTASAADKHLIVPGESIGPVKIGSTRTQVGRAWGSPDVVAGTSKVMSWRWGTRAPLNYPRVVLFRRSGKEGMVATAVSTRDMLFHTAAGITPRQSTTADVMAAYPTATCGRAAGVCTLPGSAGRVTRFSLTDGESPTDPKIVVEITVGQSG